MTIFNCFKCNQEVVFDSAQVGKNGRKIPLDPATHTPHDCPMREKRYVGTDQPRDVEEREEKDDHGNESYSSIKHQIATGSSSGDVVRIDYVDHTTAAAKGYFRAFAAKTTDELNEVANKWLEVQNVRFKQWGQLQTTNDGFAIALYYEEVAK